MPFDIHYTPLLSHLARVTLSINYLLFFLKNNN
jgi:hypothetical protein